MLRLYVPLLLTLIAVVSPARGSDGWPKFRGPTADGHFDQALPIRWSDTENVKWRTAIPGKGWSSPVIVDRRLFLTTAIPATANSESTEHGDLSLRLLSLDVADGSQLSNVEVFRQSSNDTARIHEKNSHASPTPFVDESRIYLHFGHQGTACLNLDGELLWKNRRYRYQPVHGNGGSPIVVGETLIFSCDGRSDSFIVALDKFTGEETWRRDRRTDAARKFSFSTPSVIEVAGRRQVITPGSNTVDALDPENGEVIWSVRYDGYSVIPKPVFGRGLVFVCSGYDRPTLLAIRPDGRADVTDTHVAWRVVRNVPHTPSLLLVGAELYMVSDAGIATCLDAGSGSVHWRKRLGGRFSASPIYAAGKIYFLDEDGTTTVIRRGKSFRRLAVNSLGERTLASFAALPGQLFIRGETHLFSVIQL